MVSGSFGLLPQNVDKLRTPMNGALVFYECMLNGGILKGGGDSHILPVTIIMVPNFLSFFPAQRYIVSYGMPDMDVMWLDL